MWVTGQEGGVQGVLLRGREGPPRTAGRRGEGQRGTVMFPKVYLFSFVILSMFRNYLPIEK